MVLLAQQVVSWVRLRGCHLLCKLANDLVGELWETLQGLLEELLGFGEVVLTQSRNLPAHVQKMVWIHLGSPVLLAVTMNIVSVQELLVKHHDARCFRLAHHCASRSEGDELPLSGVEVQDPVADFEVRDLVSLVVRSAPEGELLLEDVDELHGLGLLDLQVDSLVELADVLRVVLQLLHQVDVQSIETHLNVRQLRQRQSFDPAKHALQFLDHLWLLVFAHVGVDVSQGMQTTVLPASVAVGDSLNGFWELLEVLLNDVQAFRGVLPVLTDVLGPSCMGVVVELVVKGIRSLVLGDEPDVVSNVHLFGEVLDIQANVHHLSFFVLGAIKGHQIGASKFVDDASIQIKHLLDLLVAIVLLIAKCLVPAIFLELALEEVLGHEWVVDLPFFLFFVDLQFGR